MSGDSTIHNDSPYIFWFAQENSKLRVQLEIANKIIDEYQQQIIPGFRERAEKMEETSINTLTKKVHKNAVKHGWWNEERSFGDIIALCHAELSEALEEYRNGHKPTEVYYNGEKPEGIPIELADVVIRIMDYCGHAGIDLEKAIIDKMAYNETRPYRHGGKKL